jgi:hypothetical protein
MAVSYGWMLEARDVVDRTRPTRLDRSDNSLGDEDHIAGLEPPLGRIFTREEGIDIDHLGGGGAIWMVPRKFDL